MKARFLTICLAICFALCGAVRFSSLPAAAQSSAAAAALCSFIASAYNRGDQDKVWGYPEPVDIAGDGTLRHVYIVEQGTAHVRSIVASTRPLSPAEQEAAANSEVNFYGSIGQDMVLETIPRIFQFKGVYYVVYEGDGGPYDVVKPNVGELCTFKRHYAPVLGENHAPALCRQALAGKRFGKLPTQKLAKTIIVRDADTLDLPGPFSPSITRYVTLKLDPAAAPVTVGYFAYESSAGAGCHAAGVALLRGHDIEKSPRNTALVAAEAAMTNCRGSNAFLVHASGQTLIEIDGGAAEQQNDPSRVLARLRGNAVKTICKVDQKATYTAVPAAKAQ